MQRKGEIIVVYILIFIFLMTHRKTKDTEQHYSKNPLNILSQGTAWYLPG